MISSMSRHWRTLEAIFRDPVSPTIVWDDVEKLFLHHGATIREREGSRISVRLNGIRADFDRPHPRKEAKRYLIRDVRVFPHPGGDPAMSMVYRGYTGTVQFDGADRIFHGRVVGITDVVSFQGTSVAELEADFHAAVDSYLLGCTEDGVEAQRPFSGRFALRLPPEIHRDAALAARRSGVSVNRWIVEAIRMRLANGASAVAERAAEARGEVPGG
jgi:predicted HicB family RNase H-like nuclease